MLLLPDLIFFIPFQILILLIYILKRKNIENHVFSKIFPTKIHFLIVNLSIFSICFLYNTEIQLFCKPVLWASIIILLFIVSFLIYPIIYKYKSIKPILVFFIGLGIFISVYTILFGRYEYLRIVGINIPLILVFHFVIKYLKRKIKSNIFDALYFYPMVALAPFFILYQLWLILTSLPKFQKGLFLLSPTITFGLVIILTLKTNNIIQILTYSSDYKKEITELIEDNFIERHLTELVLGAHWKYHTELCLLDGRRPPFHDPILVSANKILFPFSTFDDGLHPRDSKLLYTELFPENKTLFKCKCAKKERLDFFE